MDRTLGKHLDPMKVLPTGNRWAWWKASLSARRWASLWAMNLVPWRVALKAHLSDKRMDQHWVVRSDRWMDRRSGNRLAYLKASCSARRWAMNWVGHWVHLRAHRLDPMRVPPTGNRWAWWKASLSARRWAMSWVVHWDHLRAHRLD